MTARAPASSSRRPPLQPVWATSVRVSLRSASFSSPLRRSSVGTSSANKTSSISSVCAGVQSYRVLVLCFLMLGSFLHVTLVWGTCRLLQRHHGDPERDRSACALGPCRQSSEGLRHEKFMLGETPEYGALPSGGEPFARTSPRKGRRFSRLKLRLRRKRRLPSISTKWISSRNAVSTDSKNFGLKHSGLLKSPNAGDPQRRRPMPSAAFFVGLQHRLTDPHIRGEF